VPIVCADLADFRQMAQGEELAIEFYPPGDAQGLADCIVQLLENPAKQQTMATQNFSAGLRMTMPNVVQKYLRHFELQQRVQTLRNVAQIRRLPRWIPSKALLLRFMTRNSLGWARRSAVLHTNWSDRDDSRLLNSNANGRGKLNGTRGAVDGDGVTGGSAGFGHSVGGAGASPAAGRSTDYHRSQDASPKNGKYATSFDLADQRQPKQPEAEEPGSEQAMAPVSLIRGDNFPRDDSKNGTGSRGPGSDGSGRE
jgi:hypothetical protein